MRILPHSWEGARQSAQKGEGATCNGAPIHVAGNGGVAGRMLCYGIDADPAHTEVARAECALLAEILLAGPYKLRGSNSAFDIAMVARGRYGAFLNRTSKIWDNVAPQIIVEEAGAVGRRSTGRRSTIPAP